MPKGPKLSDQVRNEILKLWRQDSRQRAKEVLDKLGNGLPDGSPIPSLRAVQGALTDVRKRVDWRDHEWAIHLMANLDIPTQAASLLLDLSLLQKEAGHILTVRDAKWCLVVHGAAPELKPIDMLSIATHYGLWQFLAERRGMDPVEWDFPVIGFLNGLLMYKPWTSEEARQALVEAIPNEVPFPAGDLAWAKYAYCLGAAAPREFSFQDESPKQRVPLPPPFSHDTMPWSDAIQKIVQHINQPRGGSDAEQR